MNDKLFVVKFKENDEGLNELKVYKENLFAVVSYIYDTFKIKDTLIESIDEVKWYKREN